MDENEQFHAATGEICVRCKQPLSLRNTRCPHCGHPVSGISRNVPLLIGVGGLGAILFVVLLMWLVVRNEDLINRPLPSDQNTAARSDTQPPTSTQTDREGPKTEEPPPPNQ